MKKKSINSVELVNKSQNEYFPYMSFGNNITDEHLCWFYSILQTKFNQKLKVQCL